MKPFLPGFCSLVLGLLPACGTSSYKPTAFVPDPREPLELPATTETIAVLPLEDLRPPFQRQFAPLVQVFDDSWSRPSYYWYFDGKAEIPAGEELATAEFPRITGDGAFLWYSFPHPGVGDPRPSSPGEGLADYLALSLERRRISKRVIRVASLEEARAAGATYVLKGSVHSFAGLFVEDHSPFIPRPDDVREYRLYTLFDLELGLSSLSSQESVWGARYSDPPEQEEDPHLFDELAQFRGDNFRPILRLDPGAQAGYSYRDLLRHLQRRLSEATGETLTAIETALRQSGRID